MPISSSALAAAVNSAVGLLSSTPCDSPLGDRRIAVVGVVAQELVDQIAVRAVHLHAVEPGGERVPCGMRIIVEQPRNLRRLERARGLEILLAIIRVRLASRRGRRGRHRLPADHRGMHLPAHMPHLHHDPPARGVDRIGDELPVRDLFVSPQPRRERPAEAFAADARRLGDDQTRAGPLRVIVGHQGGRYRILRRAPAGERGHQDAARAGDRPEPDGIEQAGHEGGSFCCDAAQIGRYSAPCTPRPRQEKLLRPKIARRRSPLCWVRTSRSPSVRGSCGWPMSGRSPPPSGASCWRHPC